MNTAELKVDLYKLIEQTNDISILKALKNILKSSINPKDSKTSDFWDELPEIIKTKIQISIDEANKGDVYTHLEVVEEMEEKYSIKL